MSTPFISETDLGLYLRQTLDADALAVIATDAACQLVREFLNQDLDVATADVVSINGSGTDVLLLPELPVTAVTTVVLALTDGSSAETLVAGTDYKVSLPLGLLFHLTNVWTRGRENVEVTYTHGYATVPSDIRLVALHVAARIYDHPGVVQESTGSYSATYEAAGLGLTAGEKVALTKHKSIRVGR